MAKAPFEAEITGVQNPMDIPSTTGGRTTKVLNTGLAEGITALGQAAEAGGKAYLKNKAYKESKAAGDKFLRTQENKTDSQKIADGDSNPFIDTPSSVQKLQAESKDSIDMAALKASHGGNAEMAALKADEAIRRVEQMAPGWADEIRQYSADKLGYDPGGRYMKLRMQREAAERQDSRDVRLDAIRMGVDVTKQGWETSYSTRLKTQSIEEAAKTASDKHKAELALQEQELRIGKLTREQAEAKKSSIMTESWLSTVKAQSDVLTVETQGRFATLSGFLDAQGKVPSENVEPLQAELVKSQGDLLAYESQLAQLEAASVGTNFKDGEVTRTLASLQARVDSTKAMLAQYDIATRTGESVKIDKHMTELRMQEKYPSWSAAVLMGKSNPRSAATKFMEGKLNQEFRASVDDKVLTYLSNSKKSPTKVDAEIAQYYKGQGKEFGDRSNKVTATSIGMTNALLQAAVDTGALTKASPEELTPIYTDVIKQLTAVNEDMYETPEFKGLLKTVGSEGVSDNLVKWLGTASPEQQQEFKDAHDRVRNLVAHSVQREVGEVISKVRGSSDQFGKLPLMEVGADGKLTPTRALSPQSRANWAPNSYMRGYRTQDHARVKSVASTVNDSILFDGLLDEKYVRDVDKENAAIAYTVRSGMGEFSTVKGSNIPLMFVVGEGKGERAAAQITHNAAGALNKYQVLDGNVYVYDSAGGIMTIQSKGVPKNLTELVDGVESRDDYGKVPYYTLSSDKLRYNWDSKSKTYQYAGGSR